MPPKFGGVGNCGARASRGTCTQPTTRNYFNRRSYADSCCISISRQCMQHDDTTAVVNGTWQQKGSDRLSWHCLVRNLCCGNHLPRHLPIVLLHANPCLHPQLNPLGLGRHVPFELLSKSHGLAEQAVLTATQGKHIQYSQSRIGFDIFHTAALQVSYLYLKHVRLPSQGCLTCDDALNLPECIRPFAITPAKVETAVSFGIQARAASWPVICVERNPPGCL